MQATLHVPVMLSETVRHLNADKGGCFLDCTLGGGGHTRAILEAHPSNEVVAIDRDKKALERAKIALQPFLPRLKLIHADFKKLPELSFERQFAGVLADLGISSDQLSENRGFSFSEAAPLDMRMDSEQTLSAEEIVNQSSAADLLRILKQGGVRQEARAAVKAILEARPVKNSAQLASVLGQSLKLRRIGRSTNPATVVFQAIRIAVNDELGQLRALLDYVPTIVLTRARLVLISFHSLEDKIVASAMRAWAGSDYSASWPGSQPKSSLGSILTKRALTPSEDELNSNARSRSARMRVFEFV